MVIYRDYVIRAFNEDRPYDQFVRDQIAGDLDGMGKATGFLVAGPHVPAATVGQEPTAIRKARADRMDEIMQTVCASMLGMTVSCARYIAESWTYQVPGYRVSAQQADGIWKQIGSTKVPQQSLQKNAARKQARRAATAHSNAQRLSRVFSVAGAPRIQRISPFWMVILGSTQAPRILSAGSDSLDPYRQGLSEPRVAPSFWRRHRHDNFRFRKCRPTAESSGTVDWLAAEFVQPQDPNAKPWSTKDLIRRVVLSDAFRQSSAPRGDATRTDASNSLLWRYSPQ